MRSYLELVDVPGLINSESSCEAKVSLFQQIITTGLDAISPFQSKTVCNTEARWVSSSLKTLIRKRQTALHKKETLWSFVILETRLIEKGKTVVPNTTGSR